MAVRLILELRKSPKKVLGEKLWSELEAQR